ncbi:TraX family protein [Aerosakkonemataceae cyanobacterium BLCC-F154]|uniref:TraX family protein n=1 Tax=Floridaenema fluviatile BLCC-F154 TaxID=3153640 RepID=A0ABV4YGI7_9CYAN
MSDSVSKSNLQKLTAFDIKLIAFSLMIIDHVGRLFFPQVTILVILGRLSFPLFTWLAAQGEKYTSDIKKYVFRLLIWGVITQPIYAKFSYLIFSVSSELNILFTLALGVITIRCTKLVESKLFKFLIVIAFMIIAELLRVEGRMSAIILIYLMSIINLQSAKWWFFFIGYRLLFIYLNQWSYVELFGIASVGIIALYNGEKGGRSKPFYKWFYPLYPLHLGVLLLIKWWLNSQIN